jgi:hypothetical protein
VYGLETIFEAAQSESLPLPEDMEQLGELLDQHLYIEGEVRVDGRTVRAWTDDDEVEVAYFFIDDDVTTEVPDRLAYLLHDAWPLPEDVGAATPFEPGVPVQSVTMPGAEEATTYAVFLTFDDAECLARSRPIAFPGVSLPGLAGNLRDANPSGVDGWPDELLVLRALVGPDDDRLGPALERCNRWPGFNLDAGPGPDLRVDHGAAHERARSVIARARMTGGRQPDRTLLELGDHLAQVAMHCNEPFGHQQWFLFDDTWASSHSDLARSLLRYANHWDPFSDLGKFEGLDDDEDGGDDVPSPLGLSRFWPRRWRRGGLTTRSTGWRRSAG